MLSKAGKKCPTNERPPLFLIRFITENLTALPAHWHTCCPDVRGITPMICALPSKEGKLVHHEREACVYFNSFYHRKPFIGTRVAHMYVVLYPRYSTDHCQWGGMEEGGLHFDSFHHRKATYRTGSRVQATSGQMYNYYTHDI